MTLGMTRNGKKCHNWTTNGTVVDTKTDETTRRFLDDCTHLTPARMAELDNLIEVTPEVRAHNAGLVLIKSDAEPDKDILKALDEDQGDWMDTEPTAAALRAIDRE